MQVNLVDLLECFQHFYLNTMQAKQCDYLSSFQYINSKFDNTFSNKLIVPTWDKFHQPFNVDVKMKYSIKSNA